MARFSNTLASRFHKLADKLECLRSGGEVEIDPAEKVDANHCPKCGLTLSTAGESCPRCLPRRAIATRLWQLMRPQWPNALAMCGLMLVGVAMELAPPKLQQYLVDDILTKGEAAPHATSLLTALLLVVLALATTRVLLGLVSWAKGLLANKVGVALTFELRSQLVRKLHSLGVDYYDRHQVGSLVSRVAYDSEVLHGLLQQITGGFLLQIVQVVAVGAMLFTLNPTLALYTLIPAPLVVGGSLFFWRRVYPHYYRYWDSSSKQAGTLSSMLSGVRVVKAFAQEPREFDRFTRSSEYLRRSRTHRVVRRRPRGARRPDDARFTHGVPRLPGHVLRAAVDALAADDLAHQLHDRLSPRLRAARRPARNREPGKTAEPARGPR
jgi:ATP-binding cassette subfamily B protein